MRKEKQFPQGVWQRRQRLDYVILFTSALHVFTTIARIKNRARALQMQIFILEPGIFAFG
jgi:hypothetical protein